MSDRIPCINPRCRRTAAREKHPNANEIVCGKCWRLLPKALTRRYRELLNRNRRIIRISKRKRSGIYNTPYQLEIMDDQLSRLMDSNWRAIRAFFIAPEKPAGIEAFLEEAGLK